MSTPADDRPHPSATKRLILLGRIVGAHGLRGEVIVRSFSETPEGIAAYGALTDREQQRSFRLKVLRTTAKGVIARIEGISDRTAAERLKGIDLYIARERLPDPEPGAFYYEDLAGLTVVSTEGAVIGRVVGVVNFGAGDLVEVRLAGSRTTELVPFADAFVPEVDVAGGRIVIDMSRVAPAASPDDPEAPEDDIGEDDDGMAGAEGIEPAEPVDAEETDRSEGGDGAATSSRTGEKRSSTGGPKPKRGSRSGKSGRKARPKPSFRSKD